MSSIENVITTTFRARGTQAIATMGQISQGFGNVGRAINETTKLSERLNTQFKAMATTLRYMVAGNVIYGFGSLVRQLKDVQVQMGLMSAIGTVTPPGGGPAMPLVGKALMDIGDQARAASIKALTPVNDMNDAIKNLLSTIQGIKQTELVPMATMIAQAARLSETDPTAMTQFVTTTQLGFGRQANLKNVRRTAAEFEFLTRNAPGGKIWGPQIIQQMGPLAGVVRAARGTPEDVMWMMLTGLRGGMFPATLGRGLTFMTQTLGFPGQQSKGAQQALASIGIRPGTEMPFRERFFRVLRRAGAMGVHGNLSRLSDENVDALQDLPVNEQLKAFGATGPGAQFLGTVFKRVHSLRAALALAQQFGAGQAQQDIKDIDKFQKDEQRATKELRDNWERFRKQARLEETARTLEATRLSVATALQPTINLAAGGVSRVARGVGAGANFLEHHRTATFVGEGILTALAFTRLLGGVAGGGRFGRLGGVLGKLGGTGRFGSLLRGGLFGGSVGGMAGRAFVGEQAVEAAMKGGGVLGSSPMNPMYVIVVGQIFGTPVVGGPGGLGPGGKKGPVDEVIRTTEDIAGAKVAGKAGGGILRRSGSLFSKGWRALRGGGKAIMSPAERLAREAALYGEEGIEFFAKPSRLRSVIGTAGEYGGAGMRFGARLGPKVLKGAGPIGALVDFFSNVPGAAGSGERQWEQQRYQKAIDAARLAFPGMNIRGITSIGEKKVAGRVELFMTLDTIGPNGKVRHPRVHIPLNLEWKDGAVPGNKGQAGKTVKR